jgi:enoyl-CoA hydratase/carnithine racemase
VFVISFPSSKTTITMVPPPQPLQVPHRYADLGFKEVKIENYPKNSSEAVTPIQVLTLYRPGKHNAFTYTMTIELETAYALFDVDDRVKCIVHTGDGRIFCAGADLEVSFHKTDEKINDHRDGYV